MATNLNFEDWLALTQLYADYASAVDSGNWDLWPEFFTEQCVYRLQPRENFERGFPLATLSFTSKGMLKDRVYGIKETLLTCCCRITLGKIVVITAVGPPHQGSGTMSRKLGSLSCMLSLKLDTCVT